jgi:hypothetical protein
MFDSRLRSRDFYLVRVFSSITHRFPRVLVLTSDGRIFVSGKRHHHLLLDHSETTDGARVISFAER